MAAGVQFIQDEKGKQLIAWGLIKKGDIVITPAFGTTIEIQKLLEQKGVEIKPFDTTCPFVEKVWKRGNELALKDATLIIHGKSAHEETRATFSQTNGPRIIVENLEEAKELIENIRNSSFDTKWNDRVSEHFNFETDFTKIGVINQTTMLAEETHKIAETFEHFIINSPKSNSVK